MSLLLEELRKAVVEGNAERTKELSQKTIETGVDPLKVVEEAFATGVREVGDRFGRGEAFLVDLIMAGDAMKEGMTILLPKIREMKATRKSAGKAVVGTVRGDVHSIGKDIVATMLEAEGFDVTNLGEDVPTEDFVEKVRELSPDILGLSALLTMSMPAQKEVIDALEKQRLRNTVRVIVGGSPTSETWANEIGADGWAGDAVSAANLAKKLATGKDK